MDRDRRRALGEARCGEVGGELVVGAGAVAFGVRMQPMRRVVAGCGAVLVLWVFPAGAGADVGALSPLGASSATGLIGAWDVAVSPDNKSVYVVGNGSDPS